MLLQSKLKRRNKYASRSGVVGSYFQKVDTGATVGAITGKLPNTVDVSWSHVARELEESRQNGAVWDASLFRLTESRQNAA
jgi:hypothetical protein